MSEPLELKKTLNLPKTDFPMKASLPQNEPKQLVAWQEGRLYERILEVRQGKPLFVLHDGPPYPTGEIHLGTGLNKILKDLVVKTRSMAGHYAPYVPGWDCHGLPIETQVEKELGGKGKVPPAEFRKLCRQFAARFVEQHKRDFKRLGIFGRWNDPYLTMSFDYEATIAGAFLDFMESGYVYRGRKPVYWCIHDSTALAEAEVEYEDHTSPSIWVKFGVVGGGSGEAAKIGPDVNAVIWTTTPWTIPHNRALAFHPDFEYVVVETERGALLLAADRVAALQAESGIKEARIQGKFKGADFSGMKFQHPFLPIQVPGILAEYVTLDQGSGIVHTAPGHGSDDFYSGQKYGLEIYAPVDDRGVYLEGLPEYKGKDVFTANPIIVKLLAERGALLGNHEYKHSYPHCWRCHNPVIFRATEQWFIKIDAAALGRSASLRQEALGEIRHVKWIPAWGEDRMYDMIAERPDWCVSGSSNLAVLTPKNGLVEPGQDWRPADVYLEGPDQYRGWFHSSLLVATGVRDASPYRGVVTHGWTLDEQGRPMSKSLGNALYPIEICERWGADLLRLWVASVEYQADVKMSERVMTQLSEAYRKIRNTFRFALGNLSDFDPSRDALPNEQLAEMDRWMLERTAELVTKCREWYAGYDFHRVYHAIHDFCVVDLSSFYYDVLKDRLYTKAARNKSRRSAQTAIWKITSALVRLIAPVLVFTSEEIWRYLPKAKGEQPSVHMAEFPDAESLRTGIAPGKRNSWERLLGIRSQVLSALETARDQKLISSSLEARITLVPKTDRSEEERKNQLDFLRSHLPDLPALFIVSQVEVSNDVFESPGSVTEVGATGDLIVVVHRATGKKCERCWNYSVHVGENSRYPTICERCSEALAEIEGAAAHATI